MATKKPAVDMCFVQIDLEQLIMPAAKGLQLVRLLQSARNCERGYSKGYLYAPNTPVHVEFALIQPGQIVNELPKSAEQGL